MMAQWLICRNQPRPRPFHWFVNTSSWRFDLQSFVTGETNSSLVVSNDSGNFSQPLGYKTALSYSKWNTCYNRGLIRGYSTTNQRPPLPHPAAGPPPNEKTNQNQKDHGLDPKWKVLSDHHPSSIDDNSTSWQEMEKSLKYWVIQGDANATYQCFHLLDLLCQQQQQQKLNNTQQRSKKSSKPSIGTHSLNQIVNNWRKLVKQRQQQGHNGRSNPRTTRRPSQRNHSQQHDDDSSSERLLRPSEVVQRLDQYRQIASIRPDVRTYAMILDAASCWDDDPTEGVLFADEFLNRLIDEYNHYLQSSSGNTRNEQRNQNVVQPDVFTFGSVIHAWSKSGHIEAPQRANGWLRRIKELKQEHPSWKKTLKLNAVLYTSVIMASSKAGDAHHAERVLEDLLEDYQQHILDGDTNGSKQLKPDLYVFNAVLHAWSRAIKANPRQYQSQYVGAKRAESILFKMQQLHSSGDLDEGPSFISYNTVLDCWAQSAARNQKHAPERAEAILRQMNHHSSSSSSSFSPSSSVKATDRSYNMVINAYSRAGDAYKAEELLKEMVETYQRGNVHVKPDVRSFSSVLAAFARLATHTATSTTDIPNPRERTKATIGIAERAEALLRRMQELYQTGQFDIQPNFRTYSSVIACWAQASSPNNMPIRGKRGMSAGQTAADRAEALLREMKQHDDPTDRPDVVTYTNVLNAFARAGNPHRAEELLEEMLNDFASGKRHSIQPNVQSFTSVLSAWSNSSDPDSAKRAEQILTRMTKLYESGTLDNCKPNVVSYSCVLNCWANASSPTQKEAANRAQALLESMKESIDPDVHPNAISYGAAIKAHAHAGQAPEAEKLLEEMIHDYQRNGNKQVQPDNHTFSLVLSAWSHSTLPHAAERAEAILIRMQDLYASGVAASKPNVVCYSSVLQCWAKSKLDGAAERAEAILRSMKQKDASIQPNLVAYNQVINAYANKAIAASVRARRQKEHGDKQVATVDAVDEAVEKALSILEELLDQSQQEAVRGGNTGHPRQRNYNKKDLLPDEYTYHAILKTVGSLHDHKRAQVKIEHILDTMKRHGVTPSKAIRDLLARIKSRHST